MIHRFIRVSSLIMFTAIILSSVFGQVQLQKKAGQKPDNQINATTQGTPGKIAKFNSTKTLGDSNMTEDDSGNVGIGTTLPTSQLTVNGVIEMMGAQSGIKFPDGTIQTSAGLTTVIHDITLKGNGTQSSRLGLQVPLQLSSSSSLGAVLYVSNGADGFGIWASANKVAVRGFGGPGALGVEALGGNKDGAIGGDGIHAFGGLSNDGNGGTAGFFYGGTGTGAGHTAGHGVESYAGFGLGAPNGLAGKFHGDVQVTGVLSKAGGSFKIDHPLDPENKYLSHSFVESPDMKNIYDGIVSLDGNGEAVVEMPEWFSALNRDFRYLLTAVGAPMPGLYISDEITSNRFKISGGQAGMRVSWQVTGIRQDAWANKNRIRVEEAKSEKERGHYLHPEAFNKEEERGVDWANRPEMMQQLKERRFEKVQPEQPRQ